MAELNRFTKISDYHRHAHLPPPQHPLISVVDYSQVRYPDNVSEMKLVQEYYSIGLKRNVPYKLYYGQQEYDFDGGLMTFIAPNQVMSVGANPNVTGIGDKKPSGRILFVHPDFLWNTTLAKSIQSFAFFGYSIHEALFLSEKEEQMMLELYAGIEREYQGSIDKFSQKIIVSQIEVLLNYAERFYERQFITRQKANHLVLEQMDDILEGHFANLGNKQKGLPTVEQVAEELHLSPNYLSALLKSITGMSTQQHIHNKLIDKAKIQLSTTRQSISEIAYDLGFERPSSFTKLFKNKTELSPLEFRKTFN